ncbi:MAG: S41 family peptidase [Porphyromonas sp.]|nr:S41 family peptidase [Porphyromonas sp.]
MKQFKYVWLLALLFFVNGSRAETPKWIRHTAISPDGTVIAFSYKGNIFTVPVQGGRATQITSQGHDQNPVWSPSGDKLAFASDREGGFDVYVSSRYGGEAQRITYHSASEIPLAFVDDSHVLYEAYIRPAQQMGAFPMGRFTQVYCQSLDGGRPTMFSAESMLELSVGEDGRVLYTDIKGYEDPFRKHHTSSITRDIWMWTPEEGGVGSFQKLTSFAGENRTARWLPGQKSFLYTNEQDGTLNVYRADIEDASSPVQLTKFTKHPVRYLSVSKSGDAAFSWNGELYYMPLGGEARKVNVEVIADLDKRDTYYRTLRSGATHVALSPNEKEVAFIVNGEVYVTSIEYNTTKRLTNTPQQERDLTFSPDGRKLVYSAERDGKWNLYMSEIAREEDKSFVYASEIREKQLTNDSLPSFQPLFSPDGKEVAFLRDRSAIYVLNIETMQERMVMDKKFNYSYSDGDQSFNWSPDGRWIITDYIGVGGWNNTDIAIFKADGSGEVHNLTESGYNEGNGRFVMDGKAVIFSSDRAGYRSHGSWGAERDLYMMFLDQEAYDQYLLNKEERGVFAQKKESEEEDKEKEKKDKEKKDAPKVVAPLTFELEGRDDRTIRLTRSSGMQSDYVMNKKGDMLYYLASFDRTTNLYSLDLAQKETKLVLGDTGVGMLKIAKDDKTLYFFGNAFYKIEGNNKTPIRYEARFDHRPAEERAYIFDHVIDQVENKFYDANIHGVDWRGYAEDYKAFLPYINNDYDFAELLSELLGELNASHTGARVSPTQSPRPVASLGLFYDLDYQGEGMRIAEVIKGGPMDKAKSVAKEGAIIMKVNGEPIAADKTIDYYLRGMAGEWVLLTIKDTDGKEVEEHIRPISYGSEQALLYKRWVDQRSKMVEKWSDGKIGYIHIQGMDSESFRKTFKDLLGKYRHCDAVVIDTRFNGGGWLHEDLAILLSGKEYSRFAPRGQYIGSDPFAQWFKPSVVLMSEGNYSNAHGFPWVYKQLGIGRLVGAPVPGTMTAVWWERQINPALVFGIPQTTVTDLEGNALENQQLNPDILVYNTPEQDLRNEDAQLRVAVEALMEK